MRHIRFLLRIFSAAFLIYLIICLLSACSNYELRDTFDPVSEMYVKNIHDQLFDSGWKFHKGDVNGAELQDYDDSGWRILDVPHDWSIEDLNLTEGAFPDAEPQPVGPFSPDSPGDISTGYVLGGIGWYRKTFDIKPEYFGRIVKITFDGVYMNADFWINGHHLGNHPYGYTAFTYDITPFLKPGKNVMSVRVNNEGRNSRWYSGSGIYRHVWLSVTDPLHFDRWGLFVTTPQVRNNEATINIQSGVINYYDHDKEFELETIVFDPSGNIVLNKKLVYKLNSGVNEELNQSYTIESPELWELNDPNLYLVKLNLFIDGDIVDQLSTTLGIRSIDFSIDKGFLLNEKTVLIKGGNMHHDNGPLGAATIDRAEFRRVELMKSFGFNAIRTSHNPPSRQFLDACDKLGILVMDESFDQWQRPKNPNDYNLYFDDWWEKDIESMVKRDRNHPSVIIWSIGNEINERGDLSGLYLTKVLSDKVKSLDPTRPVTAGICGFWEFPGRPWEDTAPAFELFDVAGYNYQWQRYEEDHLEFPERLILGTESFALDVFDNWKMVEKHSWVMGDFLWTSMDYLGEAGIGNALLDGEEKTWPWFNAYCGDIDLCGFKKPQSYYRDVVWGISKLEVAVHAPIPAGRTEILSRWGWPDEQQSWNWDGHEGKLMNVSVYSSYDSVIMELNGRKLAAKVLLDTMEFKTYFDVPYEPGELVVKGYSNGILAETKKLSTTGKMSGIRMTPDRTEIKANRNDLSYITVEVIDDNGKRVPDAEVVIDFEIQGKGKLAGVGNSNPTDMKSFQQPHCKTFKGRCLLIVQPLEGESGEILVIAKSDTVPESRIKIDIIN
jgi:beta-galactosidase